MSNYNQREQIEVLKHKLLDWILFYGSIFALITMLISFLPLDELRFNFDFYTDWFGVLSLFAIYASRNRVSVNIKSNVILVILFIFLITDVMEFGLYSFDKVVLVVIPFFSIIVYSLRTTIILYGLALVAYFTLGFLIMNGHIETAYYGVERFDNITRWIESAAVLTIIAGVIVAFTKRYSDTLFNLVEDLEQKNEELLEREYKLNEAQTFAKIGNWDFNLTTSRLDWSSELFNIFDLPPTPPDKLYEAYRGRFHKADLHKLDNAIEMAVSEKGPVEFEHRIILDNGEIKHIKGHIESELNNKGSVARLIGIAQDITESKKAEEVLRNREALLSAIAENFPRSYLSVIDKDLIIHFTGGQEFKSQDLDPDQFIGVSVEDVFKPMGGDIYETISEAYKKTLEGHDQVFEIHLGDQYQLYKTIPLHDENGEINSLLAVVENISERVNNELTIKRSLEEKEVLLQEIHHRVKNNLAVVSGLLELQSYRLDDIDTRFMLSKSTNRILSIAKVHEMLYQSSDFNNISFAHYINELSNMILTTMNSDDIEIEVISNVQVEKININQGVPLGIIFNELITNSVKYGFPGTRDNKIMIDVTRNDQYIHVEYADNGVGIPDFDKVRSTGLGITLIDNLLEQLEAKSTYETEDGFKLIFEFLPITTIDNTIRHLAS